MNNENVMKYFIKKQKQTVRLAIIIYYLFKKILLYNIFLFIFCFFEHFKLLTKIKKIEN